MCPRSTQISPCYVGSHIVHICALILPTLPLSLSPSTGDLVSNWAVLVGWPSPIKDAHFTYHHSLWLAGSHPFIPATPRLRFRSDSALGLLNGAPLAPCFSHC